MNTKKVVVNGKMLTYEQQSPKNTHLSPTKACFRSIMNNGAQVVNALQRVQHGRATLLCVLFTLGSVRQLFGEVHVIGMRPVLLQYIKQTVFRTL